jgi:hypothetical protein
LNKKEVHETRISTTLLLKAGLRDNQRATLLAIVVVRVIVRIDYELRSPFASLQKTDHCSEQVRLGVPQSRWPPQRPHPDPRSLAVGQLLPGQFLAMVRFEQRGKLAELPDDLARGRNASALV